MNDVSCAMPFNWIQGFRRLIFAILLLWTAAWGAVVGWEVYSGHEAERAALLMAEHGSLGAATQWARKSEALMSSARLHGLIGIVGVGLLGSAEWVRRGFMSRTGATLP